MLYGHKKQSSIVSAETDPKKVKYPRKTVHCDFKVVSQFRVPLKPVESLPKTVTKKNKKKKCEKNVGRNAN